MAVDAKTLELRELVLKKYRYIDRKWDLVFWVTAAFVVGAAVTQNTRSHLRSM